MSDTPLFSDRVLACLRAPGHDHDCKMEASEQGLRCAVTGEDLPSARGVPSLFRPPEGEAVDVTTKVRSFYEENPFPSYEGLEEFGELVSKGNENPFTVQLLRAIGYNKLVLEVGCGTGQLSHYLQLNNNHTLGVDMSLASLRLAMEHKLRNQLHRSSYAQMNIFDLGLRDDAFDVAIAHGCLHHTYDARKAFACVARKVKPGGVVMVGLYNSYARIPTWVRTQLLKTFGLNLDSVVRSRIHEERKADIWLKDQYYNPHETWHSLDEVLRWFDENDIDYLNCIPGVVGTDGEKADEVFEATDRGTWPLRAMTQVSWLWSISREGALFDVVGRRRA